MIHIDGLTLQEAYESIAAVSALLRNAPEPECERIATLTDRIAFAYGPYVGTTEPITVCVTCHAWVTNTEPRPRFTVPADLEEQP